MIELRVPISPTPSFINQTRLLAASLREFYPTAKVRAFIGTERGYLQATRAEREALETLTADRIRWTWISSSAFGEWAGTRSPYLATMNARFDEVDHDDVSHIIIADADVLICGPLTELFGMDAVQGVMTHVPPMPPDWMRAIWRHFTGREDWRTFQHSGAGIMCGEDEASPWYTNSGFVFAPRRLFERMVAPYDDAIAFLRRASSDTYWFDQFALGLAAAKAGVPVEALPLRWNFPNQLAFDKKHPVELANVRVLHYLRTDIVDRTRDFESDAAIRRFVCRHDLTGSNEALRRRVGELAMKSMLTAPSYDPETAPYA